MSIVEVIRWQAAQSSELYECSEKYSSESQPKVLTAEANQGFGVGGDAGQ
jgi:hypothetical protein